MPSGVLTYLPGFVERAALDPSRARSFERVNNQMANLVPKLVSCQLQPILALLLFVLLADVTADDRRPAELDAVAVFLKGVQASNYICYPLSACFQLFLDEYHRVTK